MSGGSSERQRFRREELFRLARLPNGEDDKGRADAIRVLHRLYLRQKKAEARALGIRVRIGLPPVSPGGRSAMVNSQLEDLFNQCHRILYDEDAPPFETEGSISLAYHVASELPVDVAFRQILLAERSEAERQRRLVARLTEWYPQLQKRDQFRAKATGNGHTKL